ncbi:MAG: LPP20 family lipoprotein [Bacteroidales bacterium]|jgi:hypothetical protein|nr:LPP20 family lipoprotein [Bacteroidales bacterium]
MKKYFLLLFVGFSITTFGQSIPNWTEEEWRELNYPAELYYTGFVREKLQNNISIGDALGALENSAKNQLAESIIIKIEGSTKLTDNSTQQQIGDNRSETITTQYMQAVSTATSATAVGMEIKSYYNPSNNMMYAFAFAKRSDLSAFYTQQIDLDINKVESLLSLSEQLVASGKKMQANGKCLEAQKILIDIASYQNLLTAINVGTNESALQINRINSLNKRVEKQLIELEQSTLVYLDCKYEKKGNRDDAFSSDPEIFRDIIAQALSENGCSITNDRDSADYELNLITYTTCRSDGKDEYGIISYYANVKGTLINPLTKKKLLDFSVLNAPYAYATGKSPEAAATKAFMLPELKNKVLKKILEKIKN